MRLSELQYLHSIVSCSEELKKLEEYINKKLNINLYSLTKEYVNCMMDSFTLLECVLSSGHRFMLCTFPGNCSWLIVYSLNNETEIKLRIAELIADLLHYSHVFISLSSRQRDLISLILSLGYKQIHNNVNHHSNNEVFLFLKEIPL